MIREAATALMILAPIQYAAAQAASPQIINLACEGANLVERGITVNLANGTVSGGWGVIPRITKAEDASIEFSGEGPNPDPNLSPGSTLSISGSIDRVTGHAMVERRSYKPDGTFIRTSDDLTCRVTNRLF